MIVNYDPVSFLIYMYIDSSKKKARDGYLRSTKRNTRRTSHLKSCLMRRRARMKKIMYITPPVWRAEALYDDIFEAT